MQHYPTASFKILEIVATNGIITFEIKGNLPNIYNFIYHILAISMYDFLVIKNNLDIF